MRPKLLAALLATALAAGTATAQTQVPATIERGTYLEQTAGDLDGAIAVYRKLAEDPAAKRETRAEAQYRLVLGLLKKGDLIDLNKQGPILEKEYADFPQYIKDVREKRLAEQRKPIGELVGSHYRHFKTGVEFDIPKGFSIASQGMSSDSGDMVELEDKDHQIPRLAVWMIAEKNTPEQINDWIRLEIGAKVQMRESMGITGNVVRFDEVKEPVIDGHRGLIYILDYQENKTAMSELFTYAVSGKTRILFLGNVPRERLKLLQDKMGEWVQSAKIP